LIKRIGVRYVNQLAENAFEKVDSLINEKLLTIYKSELFSSIKSNISEAQFVFEKNHLLARWGVLPERSTIDPNMLKPIGKPSWILDIDASNPHRAEWSGKFIIDELKKLTELNYGFFRWSVTQNFLEHYGVSKQ